MTLEEATADRVVTQFCDGPAVLRASVVAALEAGAVEVAEDRSAG
ncbi:hypothetical protein [Micromonospora sp. HUAS LYJ1]|nr:hypothetical protein [Micromonospora sp. HUAS LYJ1]WKU03785.1 hypothetical protein Q2K16_23520 [Micromonospora sp. HUAS LYJ1]